MYSERGRYVINIHLYISREISIEHPSVGLATLAQLIIRECSSTLYVGLARAVPPTNTNFRLTFLLTRLQEALYEDLAV